MIAADVVAVTLAAVLVNHMGLIEAVEGVIGFKLPVINCSRCLTFWSVLVVLLIGCGFAVASIPLIVATSFIAAYAAIWLELLFGIIDKQYEKIYKKTYPEEAAEARAGDTHAESAAAGLSELREIKPT